MGKQVPAKKQPSTVDYQSPYFDREEFQRLFKAAKLLALSAAEAERARTNGNDMLSQLCAKSDIPQETKEAVIDQVALEIVKNMEGLPLKFVPMAKNQIYTYANDLTKIMVDYYIAMKNPPLLGKGKKLIDEYNHAIAEASAASNDMIG